MHLNRKKTENLRDERILVKQENLAVFNCQLLEEEDNVKARKKLTVQKGL